jgi:hypothetical protein
MLTIRPAKTSDIDGVLELHFRYQVDHIKEEDKSDGFVTTPFTKEQLNDLVSKEDGIIIALHENKIVAYALVASWHFWSAWPFFQHMIKGLPDLSYKGHTLTTENSYQYGPICIEKNMRNSGIFEQLFEYALTHMAHRYPVLVTFINKTNSRSFEAHTRKAKLDIINEFEFNNNHYHELACLTTQ